MNSPLVYICLTAIFFALMLLGFNKGYKSANRFLAGVFLFSSLFYLTIFVFLFNQDLAVIAVFQTGLPSFFFLIGPLSYFYVRSILKDDSSLSRWDYLHFLLFAMAFAGTLPLFFSSWEYKLRIAENLRSNYWFNPKFRINSFFPPNFNKILKAIQLTVYVILNWTTLYRYKQQLKQRILHTRQYNIIRNWLIILCGFLSLAAVLVSFGVYNVVTLQSKALFLENYYKPLLLLSLSFLMLNLTLLLIPQILYGLPYERMAAAVSHTSAGDGDVPPDSIELSTTEAKNMPAFYSPDYLAELEFWIKKAEEDALFLDPGFRMEDIALRSGIPLHHLSYYFSNVFSLRFSEWRNQLRVDHAIKLVREGYLVQHSLEGIARQCGFSSRHTFIRAFKGITGKTPGDYLKS